MLTCAMAAIGAPISREAARSPWRMNPDSDAATGGSPDPDSRGRSTPLAVALSVDPKHVCRTRSGRSRCAAPRSIAAAVTGIPQGRNSHQVAVGPLRSAAMPRSVGYP